MRTMQDTIKLSNDLKGNIIFEVRATLDIGQEKGIHETHILSAILTALLETASQLASTAISCKDFTDFARNTYARSVTEK
jgi:hypothetical protein